LGHARAIAVSHDAVITHALDSPDEQE